MAAKRTTTKKQTETVGKPTKGKATGKQAPPPAPRRAGKQGRAKT